MTVKSLNIDINKQYDIEFVAVSSVAGQTANLSSVL